MAVVKPTTTTWTSLAAGLTQVRGGTVYVALSASPAAEDFLVLSPGDSMLTAVPVFVKSMQKGDVTVVSLVV